MTAVAPQLQQDLVNTAALLQVLAQQKTGLDTLFQQGSAAVTQVDQLVTSQAANLGCFLHDSAQVLSNIAEPSNLSNLSQGLAINQSFFGAINHVAVPGLAKATTTGAANVPNQLFLRTRLEVPPILSPAASSYSPPQQTPDILPGAGCVTAFGKGVGPATQPGFVPAGGGHVVAPTAQEADVEMNGATPPSSTAAYVSPASNQWVLMAAGGVVVPALVLAWGVRPSRVRARRRSGRPVP